MRRTMGTVFALLILAIGAMPAFTASFDFGGLASNTTGIQRRADASPAIVQSDSASLWMQTAFGSAFLLSGQVGFDFTLSPLLVALDADSLNLQASFPSPQTGVSIYRYTLGRARFSDFAGQVLDQNADGLAMTVEFPIASVSFGAAYTGLLLKPSSRIGLSRADVNDVANPAVILGTPRLLQMVQVTFPSVLRQRITLEAIAQEDMRDTVLDLATPSTTDLVKLGDTTFDPSRGGPVNTQYFGLGLDGGTAGSLYYSLHGFLQTGQVLQFTGAAYQQVPVVAYLASLGLRYYAPRLFSSAVSATFLIASGDEDATTIVEGNTLGQSTAFTPITRGSFAYVFSPQLTNVMIAEARYSLKPLAALGAALADTLQAQLRADVFLRPTTGAISEPGVSAGNAEPYLGTEADLILTARPFSDLGLSFTAGVFLPGSAFGPSAPVQYKAGLEASLSF